MRAKTTGARFRKRHPGAVAGIVRSAQELRGVSRGSGAGCRRQGTGPAMPGEGARRYEATAPGDWEVPEWARVGGGSVSERDGNLVAVGEMACLSW